MKTQRRRRICPSWPDASLVKALDKDSSNTRANPENPLCFTVGVSRTSLESSSFLYGLFFLKKEHSGTVCLHVVA